jgi:hypothetical protein
MSLQTAMRLIERRSRKQPKAEHVTYAYSKDEDQERSSYIHIEPIIFIYDSDTIERLPYTSIKDIRAIHNNEYLRIVIL